MEKNSNVIPRIGLDDLVDQIATTSYRELEKEYEKRIAADKRYYGDRFNLIQDKWKEKNTTLNNNINNVLNFKREFRAKVSILNNQLKGLEISDGNDQIISTINEIIQLINQNKDLKLDDKTSWYTDTKPEFTLESYLEKYGYSNYFQDLLSKYTKKQNDNQESIEGPDKSNGQDVESNINTSKELVEQITKGKNEENIKINVQDVQKNEQMESNSNVIPRINLDDLVDQIATTSYRELEKEYEKRISADKRYYGDRFNLIQDKWKEKNTILNNNINNVLNFKREFRAKVNILNNQLKGLEISNGNDQIVSTINEIIQLINQNKDLKLDDKTSWYTDTKPEFTLESYLEKYGYSNYFQDLLSKYTKKTNDNQENIESLDKSNGQDIESENYANFINLRDKQRKEDQLVRQQQLSQQHINTEQLGGISK